MKQAIGKLSKHEIFQVPTDCIHSKTKFIYFQSLALRSCKSHARTSFPEQEKISSRTRLGSEDPLAHCFIVFLVTGRSILMGMEASIQRQIAFVLRKTMAMRTRYAEFFGTNPCVPMILSENYLILEMNVFKSLIYRYL